jgi:energy-converting hydrogenase B subunit D
MSGALQLALDLTLCGLLLWLAWKALTSTDLFRGIVLFIAFGFLMALAWARLNAPDIALAEAAVGSGITGAMLLTVLGRMRRVEHQKERDGSGS